MKTAPYSPIRLFLAALIVLGALFPFFALLGKASALFLPLNGETLAVIGQTTLQAALSALGSLCLGVFGGLGILWVAGRFPGSVLAKIIEALAVAPNAVPVLLVLLSVAKIFPWARDLTGIVLTHVTLNAGLVAVAFARLARERLRGMAELAYVEGVLPSRFLFRVALPVLRADLVLLGLFVFAICFSSFAVPLALGGSRATTMEVLIYQNIRISGDWSRAIGLAFEQSAFVLALAWSLFVFQDSRNQAQRGGFAFQGRASIAPPLIRFAPGLLVVLLPALILAVGLFDGFAAGVRQLQDLPELMSQMLSLIAGSVCVSLGTSLLVFFVLLTIAFVRPEGWMRRFLGGYGAPSTVLVGFALLLVWRDLGVASYAKITIGLTLVFVPSFYRYQWGAALAALDGQIVVARTLGSGDWLVFHRIVFPQCVARAGYLAGLAGLWAWGDFALSSVVAERGITVALATHSLMSTYRFDAATVLIWVILSGGLLTFGLMAGAGYVLGSKPEA